MFTYSIVFKQQIYLGCVGGGGVVCGPHNCMILNIKTCFDKKVTLSAIPFLSRVVQLHPYFLRYCVTCALQMLVNQVVMS